MDGLPNAYSVFFSADTASLIGAGKLRNDGNDWRITYWDGGSWIELDRWIDDVEGGGWNSATTETWFGTQAVLGPSESDASYYLYYGYASESSTAPSEMNNVFIFGDDFESGVAKWTVRNGASINAQNTVARAGNALQLDTAAQFDSGISRDQNFAEEKLAELGSIGP